MDREEIIAVTVTFTKETLESAEGGHDGWHIYRTILCQMGKVSLILFSNFLIQ